MNVIHAIMLGISLWAGVFGAFYADKWFLHHIGPLRWWLVWGVGLVSGYLSWKAVKWMLNRLDGSIDSDYICTCQAWEVFDKRIRDLGLYIDETHTKDTSLYYIKSGPDGPFSVRLVKFLQQKTNGQHSIKVELLWNVKRPGIGRGPSFEMAARIEELLLNSGAVCTHAPVHESRVVKKWKSKKFEESGT